MCKICLHNGNVFAVEPPLFVELQITETEPDSRVILQQVQQLSCRSTKVVEICDIIRISGSAFFILLHL